MEIARVQLARSIWLFDTGDLNPQGAQIFPDLFLKAIERYGFRRYPKPEEFLEAGKSRKFEDGSFMYEGRKFSVSVELWGDGLIADTQHSTDASDAFLADLIQWMGVYLGVKYPSSMTRKRAYRSELIVYSSRQLAGLCASLNALSDAIHELAGEPVEAAGLIYSSEQKRAFFTFDRRVGEEFEANKFYTAAMTKTAVHIQILQRLGEVLERGTQTAKV